jgi:hypothetical protein
MERFMATLVPKLSFGTRVAISDFYGAFFGTLFGNVPGTAKVYNRAIKSII